MILSNQASHTPSSASDLPFPLLSPKRCGPAQGGIPGEALLKVLKGTPTGQEETKTSCPVEIKDILRAVPNSGQASEVVEKMRLLLHTVVHTFNLIYSGGQCRRIMSLRSVSAT